MRLIHGDVVVIEACGRVRRASLWCRLRLRARPRSRRIR